MDIRHAPKSYTLIWGIFMSKKQKYNFNFKLRLVTVIQQGKDSIGGLSKKEGLDKSQS